MERSQSLKKDGTESKTPRYAITAQADYFNSLTAIKNAKNEIVMYWQRNAIQTARREHGYNAKAA